MRSSSPLVRPHDRLARKDSGTEAEPPSPRATVTSGRAAGQAPWQVLRRSRLRLSPAVIWMSFATIAVDCDHRGVRALLGRRRARAASHPFRADQLTGPIAPDTSGSYSVLVQRANGLYDQGSQAFQKKQRSTGEQYFAAAAKVYRAAWKQQSTDPNVGTDYATSLFYSGDTDRRAEAGERRSSPRVRTSRPRTSTRASTSRPLLRRRSQNGQKAEADSLLAQARTEFEKAVSIDPEFERRARRRQTN